MLNSFKHFCFLFILLVAYSASAQKIDPQTAGYSYVIAFPDTSTNTYDIRYPLRYNTQLYAMVYSDAPNTRMRVTNIATKKDSIYILPQGKIARISLGKNLVWAANTPSNNTWLLESEEPVVVYCYLITGQGSEAWSALPVERWGKEYYANLMPGDVLNDLSPGGEYNYGKTLREAPAELLVIAAFDSTTVVIHPSERTVPQQDSVVVMLQAYQAYQIQSWVDTSLDNIESVQQPDLSGTYISADKPISVLCATTRSANRELSAVGLGQNTFKNPLIESVPPTEQWGQQFVYTPTWDGLHIPDSLNENRPYEWTKFITTDPAKPALLRRLQYLDNSTETFTIAERTGKQLKMTIPAAALFQVDQPALAMMSSSAVIRFSGTVKGFGSYIGAQYETKAPPYMVEMVPREQWSYSAPFASIRGDIIKSYVNIATDTASQSRLRLMINNVEAPWPTTWLPIPNSPLVWCSFRIATDSTYLVYGVDTNARFHGYVYGFGFRTGIELYRPGKIKKSSEPTLLGKSNEATGLPHLMHPSEYEEHCGLAYGYPLAPRRSTITPTISAVSPNLPTIALPQLRLLSANPFNDFADIEINLPNPAPLQLQIVDASGKIIARLYEGAAASGIHQLRWQTETTPTGIYFCQALSNGTIASLALVLIR